jgi:hypothetical protein
MGTTGFVTPSERWVKFLLLTSENVRPDFEGPGKTWEEHLQLVENKDNREERG